MATDTISQSVVKDLHGSSTTTAPPSVPPPATTKISTPIKRGNKVQNLKSEEHIVRRPFSPKSEKYIRKLDRLVKIYEKMSEKNDRLRYHIVKVKEEVNKLSHIKRHLCCRLSSFNDNYMDENLEIPDTNNRDANFEKLIGEIITNAEPVGPPASKKRKVEVKKVVIQKPKEVKEASEEPEAREAINRILNDAKSLMKQQQQEQEEMVKHRMFDQKKQQNGRQQRNTEKQAKSAAESKPLANDSGSRSAPVIQNNQKPSTSFAPQNNTSAPQPLNRTMSNPAPQTSKTTPNQQHKPKNTVNNSPSNLQSSKPTSTSPLKTQDSKPIIQNSLPLPQTPGVYILAPGQQLIKQPPHVQAEMIAKDMKQKQEEKNILNVPSSSATSVSPQKISSQSYIVTHHDLPKNTSQKSEISRQQQPNQSFSSSDSQKSNLPQSQIFIRRLHATENQTSPKIQQQQQNSQSQQQQPQIQIVTQTPKGPPLQAQITSQPLPNGSQPAINNSHPPVIRLREGNQQASNISQSQQPHPIQMEQVKLFYTQRQLQDPSTINPQLLPHRQLNAQRLHMEQQMKEREMQRKLEEEKVKEISSPEKQQPKAQSQVQPIVIQSSNVQQIHQIQSQPRLREALQNAGNDPQRQIQLLQTVPVSTVHTSGPQRIVATKQQSPAKSVLQPTQHLPQPGQIPQQNSVYFIDPSRCYRFSRDQLVGVQPFTVTGNQAIRYYLPQNISTQAITVTSSPQKQQKSKVDDGKFDRLLRASSIDHLLPDNPDHDMKNDDNIDWSIYEEPKPSKSTPRKAPTPRKRGAAIKIDSNSDAMARISPILAKFQQEMAQSTVAQEQQHQQELTMAARNAAKPTPARARKRPSKAEKDGATKNTVVQNNQTPSSSSIQSSANNQDLSSQGNNLQVPNTSSNVDTVIDNAKMPPSIIVTAATPDPSQAHRQKPTTVDAENVQTQ